MTLDAKIIVIKVGLIANLCMSKELSLVGVMGAGVAAMVTKKTRSERECTLLGPRST